MTTKDQTEALCEAMCKAHHAERSAQGFTTASWDQLEERNRQQYRVAMHKALQVGIPLIAEMTKP